MTRTRPLLRSSTTDRTYPGVAARIVERDDGAPVRLSKYGRRKKANGAYFSAKSGRHLPWESRLELRDLQRAEVRADVISSRVQPHTLELIIDGVKARYTPDREDILVGGRTEIVEVKGNAEQMTPEYWVKLKHARAVYEALGYSFRVAEESEINAQPSLSVVERIQADRCTKVTAPEVLAVQQYLRTRGPSPLAAVRQVLPCGPSSFAKLCALAVSRIIEIQVDKAIGPSSTIRLVVER